MTARLVQLGEVCEFIRGVTFDKGDATTLPEIGKTPVLRAGNIGEELDARNDLVWVPDAHVSDQQRLRQNDIAICMSSGSPEVVGKTARVPYNLRASIGSFCGIIRPKSADEASYLSFFFRSAAFRKHRNAIARGANIQNLRFSQFEEIELEIPRDQRQIARRLEQVDTLRRTRRSALELTDTFIPAAFLELFGDPVENPYGFQVEPLQDLIQPTRPISYGILMPGPHVPTGVPYIRVTDIQDGQVATALVRRTTREIDQAYKRSKLKRGDLLLSIRGHVGRMAIVPASLDGANITQDTARLATLDTLEPYYLMACLASRGMQRRMVGLTRGAAVQGINLGDVKELPIPVPPLPVQQTFAALVKRAEHLRAVQREALRQADHLFAFLLDRAFSG